jgi:hypothetical protein
VKTEKKQICNLPETGATNVFLCRRCKQHETRKAIKSGSSAAGDKKSAAVGRHAVESSPSASAAQFNHRRTLAWEQCNSTGSADRKFKKPQQKHRPEGYGHMIKNKIENVTR